MKKLVLFLAIVGVVMGCGDERGGAKNEDLNDPLIRFDVDLESLPSGCFYSSSGKAYGDRFTNGLDGYPTISEAQIDPGQTSFGPFRVDIRSEWEKHGFGEMAAKKGPDIVGVVEFAGVTAALTYVEPGFDPITLTLREEDGAIVGAVRLEKDDLHEDWIHAELKGMLSSRFYDVNVDSEKRYFIDVDTPISFHLQVLLEIEGVFVKSECL